MTFDEARLMANVNDRSRRLFENGYRAHWRDAAVLSVRNPGGTAYRVNTHAGTCDCPFFQKHAGRYSFNHLSGKHLSCKHLLGWERLLSQQRACRLFAALMLLRVWTDLDDNARVSGPQKQATDQKQTLKVQTYQTQTFQETEAIHANA